MTQEIEATHFFVQPYALEPEKLYPVDLAAHLARMPRHFLLVCCRRGLVAPHVGDAYGGLYFDDMDIRRLQRIQYLHKACGVNLAGIEIIMQLSGLVEEQRRAR
ncbi:MAG: MerR family transcriptional regulator [Verrucomicrobia bacterium]|nr:MerR family transcriptional regulator [Verrucomicrobiota bacterium]